MLISPPGPPCPLREEGELCSSPQSALTEATLNVPMVDGDCHALSQYTGQWVSAVQYQIKALPTAYNILSGRVPCIDRGDLSLMLCCRCWLHGTTAGATGLGMVRRTCHMCTAAFLSVRNSLPTGITGKNHCGWDATAVLGEMRADQAAKIDSYMSTQE